MYCACCCCHSDEDVEEPLDWLPMAPEIEDPEEPGWGQLEVRERQGRIRCEGRGELEVGGHKFRCRTCFTPDSQISESKE